MLKKYSGVWVRAGLLGVSSVLYAVVTLTRIHLLAALEPGLNVHVHVCVCVNVCVRERDIVCVWGACVTTFIS